MVKLISSIVAGLVFWIGLTSTVFPKEINSNIRSSVAKTISFNKKEKKMYMGSAFLINSKAGIFMSVFHLVCNSSFTDINPNLVIGIKLHGKSIVEAKVIKIDTKRDIALLSISSESYCNNVKALSFNDNVYVGQNIFVVAFNKDFGITVTHGIISSLNQVLDPAMSIGKKEVSIELKDLIVTDAVMNLGNSGSPIVNINGDVVGMSECIDPFLRLGAGTPSKYLKEFAKEYLPKKIENKKRRIK